MAVDIKRVRLKKPPTFAEDTRQLACESLRVLGYPHLHEKVFEGTEGLASVLRRLKIDPLDERAVERYQREKVEEKDEKEKNYDNHWHWEEYKLNDVPDVPLFILRKAIQIALAAPAAKFYVEMLENRKTYDGDPFLIVELGRRVGTGRGEHRTYIDVWDESDFEKKL